MIDQIQLVAILRERQDRLKRERADSLAIWESTNRTLLDNLGFTTNELTEAETALRAAAIAAYRATGNKTPVPGVAIKVMTKLDYPLSVALAWAVEHKVALKLDVPTFEKILRISLPEFVRIYEEPVVTIATDLSKVLADTLPAQG